MPSDFPVRSRRLVEEDRADREGVWAKDEAGPTMEGGVGGELAYLRKPKEVTMATTSFAVVWKVTQRAEESGNLIGGNAGLDGRITVPEELLVDPVHAGR